MRILQVVPRLSKQYGGGGVQISVNLSNKLLENNHHVSMIASDYGLSNEDDLAWFIDNKHNEYGEIGHRVYFFSSLFNMASLHITTGMIGMGKIFKNHDVIHMQGCRTFQNIVAHHYAKKHNIPYIVDAHGFPIEGTFIRKLFIRLFDFFFANRIVRNANYCIAESQTGVKEYKRAGVKEDKIVVIPCPYDLSVFDSLPRAGQFKKKNGVVDKKIVLFLGGLDYIKGIDFLINAFAQIKSDDAVLVLAGADFGFEKTLRKMVKELNIENKVIFTGYIDGQDKLELLVDADVAVFPSRAEQGLPFAGLEAIMCNTPIIVTRNTGAGEDIKKIGGGYLVDFDDTWQLAFLIDTILDRQSKAQEYVRLNKAQRYIRDNLSIEIKVKEYEELYRRCLDCLV